MLKEMGQKNGMTIRETKDGIPKCSIDGPRSRLMTADIDLMKGFDLTQPGLADGSVEYPSKYMKQMVKLYQQRGDHYWVRHSAPLLAQALLDLVGALTLASDRKAVEDGPRQFRKMVRRGVFQLAELYPKKLSWYLHQVSSA